MRILLSSAIAFASGCCCWFVLAHFRQGSGDFTWAIRAAADLVHGQNPYRDPQQLYPLPAAALGWPFLFTSPPLAGGIFYGVSSGLLAFGLTRHGYSRLLIFLAYPYWAGILTAQWGPILMAGSFFPWLLPAALGKPQLGLPVALTSLSRRGVLASLALLALSLAVMPSWPWLWLRNASGYQHFVPLLVLPGPMLALAALRWRERDARLLLLMAAVPQRWFYDAFVLWLIPKTRRELVWTVFFSWVPGVWRWHYSPHTYRQVGAWTVVFLYLPMLAVLVLARRRGPEESGLRPLAET